MEEEVERADCVVVVCTPTYARKANERRGGVGYEHQIVSGAILANTPRRKFIPILRSGRLESGSDCALPVAHTGIKAIDFRSNAAFAKALEDLLRTVFDKPRHQPPPLGEPPPLAPQPVMAIEDLTDTPLLDSGKRLLYRFVNQHNVMLDRQGTCYRTVQYCLENTTDRPIASVMMGDTMDRPLTRSEFAVAVTDECGNRLETEFAVDTPNYKRWDVYFKVPLQTGERLRFFSQYLSCDVGRYQGQHTHLVREGLIHYVLLREAASGPIRIEVRSESGWKDLSASLPVFECADRRIVTLPYRDIETPFQFRISWADEKMVLIAPNIAMEPPAGVR
jgi:hypothetical protein